MKIIDFKKDYGIIDFQNKSKVNEILKRIDCANENDIVLILFSVIMDYDHTSLIIDKIFDQIQNNNEDKKVTIKTDHYYKEEVLLKAIFWGSVFFGVEAYKNLTCDEIKDKISKKLNSITTRIFIEVYNQKLELVGTPYVL